MTSIPSVEICEDGIGSAAKNTKELTIVDDDSRNWRGIAAAILVIIIICAVIAVFVFFFSPEIRDFNRRTKNDKISLDEIIHGLFSPRTFNGTWLSDYELLYRDFYGNLIVLNVNTLNSEILASNVTFVHFVQKYTLSPDRRYLLLAYDIKKIFRHTYNAKHKLYRIADEELIPLSPFKNQQNVDLMYASWGPKGTQLVFVYKNNIYYKNTAEDEPSLIAASPHEAVIYNGIPDWLYEEEILSTSHAIWWSPDGQKLCYASFNDTQVDLMPYPWFGSYEDPNNLYPGTVYIRYPKPGRTNPTVTLYVVDFLNGKKTSKLRPPVEIMNTQYYFTSVSWIDNENVAIIWLNRLQNYSVVSICNSTRLWSCMKNLEVTSNGRGWVDLYDPLVYSDDRKYYFLRLPSLQRSDEQQMKKETADDEYFKHVAKVSIENGSVEFLTAGHFDTTQILTFDPSIKTLYYVSTLPGKSGERHIFGVNTQNATSIGSQSQPRCLTCDIKSPSCLYNSGSFSTEASNYVLECLGPNVPSVELRQTRSNKLVKILQTNDLIREKLENKILPQIRTFTVPLDGGYNASVRLFLPSALRDDEITRYPLLIQVYGGPGSQLVNERFQINWGYYLATNKNVIYGMIDGRGSGFRGDKLLHEIYYRLGSVEVEDQISVARYLREELPFISKDKIGIWGWSYGGYVTTMALETDRSSVFSCGIAVAPVTNWLYYDSAYTERYMGLPTNPAGLANYERADAVRKAVDIKGKKFMLIHGTADDNVHLQQSMMLTKAMAKHGVIFHSLVYPDENHALLGVTRHLHRTMEAFLNECFEFDTVYDDVGLRRRRIVKSQSNDE